jgi:hypothetical protein
MCRRAYYHLHRISRIRKFLSDSAAAHFVHAFVTSTLDYGNSLLVGLPSKRLGKLQAVQNMAARLIARRRKYDHISDVLINLHWLPTPKTKLVNYGDRSFAKMAPKIWNSIPLPIRTANSLSQFRSMLKTYLFKLEYPNAK